MGKMLKHVIYFSCDLEKPFLHDDSCIKFINVQNKTKQ